MQRAGYKLRTFFPLFSFLNGGILNEPFLEGLKMWKNTKIGSSPCFEEDEKKIYFPVSIAPFLSSEKSESDFFDFSSLLRCEKIW